MRLLKVIMSKEHNKDADIIFGHNNDATTSSI
jgi:hypothetical protein